MAADRRKPFGDRRGIPAAVTAAAGALLVAYGLWGGPGGPPMPPGSASLDEPVTSSPRSSGYAGHAPSPQAAAAAKSGASTALSRVRPAGLTIPAININVNELVGLGRQANGTIEVPKKDDTVGWYTKGPSPGQAGPAVMGGHVDSATGPAVFYNLGDLRAGDIITVARGDGTTAVFTVYGVEQYPKNEFPTGKVYGPTGRRAELRLITCGGTFNEDTRHYRDNIVVYAKLTGARPAHTPTDDPKP